MNSKKNAGKNAGNGKKVNIVSPRGRNCFLFLRNLRHKWLNQRKLIFFCEFAQIILFFLARHRNKAKKKRTPKCKIIQKRTLSHSNKIHVNPSSFFGAKQWCRLCHKPNVRSTPWDRNNQKTHDEIDIIFFWVGNRLFLPKYHSDVGSWTQNQIAWKMNTAKWRLNQNDAHHLPPHHNAKIHLSPEKRVANFDTNQNKLSEKWRKTILKNPKKSSKKQEWPILAQRLKNSHQDTESGTASVIVKLQSNPKWSAQRNFPRQWNYPVQQNT